MKRIVTCFFAVFLHLSIFGCRCNIGTEQIERIERSLSIDLEDLTDAWIKEIYSHTDAAGRTLTIQYIDLEGAEEFVTRQLEASECWCALPYDQAVAALLTASGASGHYAFESVEDGLFIISGVSGGDGNVDFDRKNFDDWTTYQIGIWDASAGTLYFVSVAAQ